MLHSCLIARNLLPGLKTCLEVSTYMNHDVAAMSQGSTALSNSFFDGDGNMDANKLASVFGFDPHFLLSICTLKTKIGRKRFAWLTSDFPYKLEGISIGFSVSHYIVPRLKPLYSYIKKSQTQLFLWSLISINLRFWNVVMVRKRVSERKVW